MKLDYLFSCDTLEKADALIQARGPIELENFVDNEHGMVIGSDPAGLRSTYIDSINPKTGTVFARVPCTTPGETHEAILAARAAFPSWSKTTRAERSAYLGRVSELLREHRELFAVWESIDQGKTLERARVEVDRAIANFSYD
jgi:aminomuconate-semialdehyde dehydrogenase